MTVVDHPEHYNLGKIEVIDAIEDWRLGFAAGNAIKYIARAGVKVPPNLSPTQAEIQDLKKARWYLDREITRLESEEARHRQAPPLPTAPPPQGEYGQAGESPPASQPQPQEETGPFVSNSPPAKWTCDPCGRVFEGVGESYEHATSGRIYCAACKALFMRDHHA